MKVISKWLIRRWKYHVAKKTTEYKKTKFIEEHDLLNEEVQKKIILDYNKSTESKNLYGRKYKSKLDKLISFMIIHEIIKVEI